MNPIKEYFHNLRLSKTHHLGLGDIRLTVAQQDEIAKMFNKARNNRDCVHPYAYVYRKGDFEKCMACNKILSTG